MTETANQHDGGSWAEELVGVLDRQRGLFRELSELSGQQSQFVERGETEALLSLLAQRQGLIDQIQVLSAKIEPFKRDWEARVAALPERHRLLIRAHSDELAELVSSIAARDERDRLTLESQRDVVSSELAQLARTRGAAGAYARETGAAGYAGPVMPRFQDRRG